MHTADAVVDCGLLPNPPNGMVTHPSGTQVGATAEYSCNDGFMLSDMTVRVCLPSGIWSGVEPTCTSEIKVEV